MTLQQLDRDASSAGARFVLVTQLPRLHGECNKLAITSLDVSAPLHPLFDLPRGLEKINEAGTGVLAHEIARYLVESETIPASHRAQSAAPEAST